MILFLWITLFSALGICLGHVVGVQHVFFEPKKLYTVRYKISKGEYSASVVARSAIKAQKKIIKHYDYLSQVIILDTELVTYE